MKYGITTLVADSPGIIEIDDVQYKRVKAANDALFELLSFEENLDLVTENFQEYESELLSIASRCMIFHDMNYYSLSQERNIVCRRIVNLLSACRMYLDQSEHHISNIYGDNSENANLLRKEIVSHYDQNFGYRVMEALRNYTQHRGFPVHSVSFSGEWVDIDSEENSRLMHTVVPLLYVRELVDDGKFKQSVLNEMRSIKNKGGFDLRPLVRNYVECLGKIHENLREAIQSDIKEWEEVVNDTLKAYQNEFGAEASLAGLVIIASEENRVVEKRTIFKEFIERRQALERKNRIFINLHKRFASNEIKRKDA